jgi:acetyl esterase/lipase
LPFTIAGDPAEQRATMEAALTAIPLPGDVTTTPGVLGGVPVLTIDVDGVDSSKVLVHFHGGVYVLVKGLGLPLPASSVALAVGGPDPEPTEHVE